MLYPAHVRCMPMDRQILVWARLTPIWLSWRYFLLVLGFVRLVTQSCSHSCSAVATVALIHYFTSCLLIWFGRCNLGPESSANVYVSYLNDCRDAIITTECKAMSIQTCIRNADVPRYAHQCQGMHIACRLRCWHVCMHARARAHANIMWQIDRD